MPAGNRALRIPADLRIVMRVQIDEAGRDDQAVGVDRALGEPGARPPICATLPSLIQCRR